MNYFNAKYFSLLKEIALCQFRLKDQSTFFGFLWSFLHPLIMLLVLLLFFHLRMGKTVQNYPIFLLIGIIHFTHFSNSTSASMSVLQSMKVLTCNVIMPKELLVLGSVIANTLEFCISMPICIVIAHFSGVPLNGALILFPLVVLLEILLVIWVSFVMSFIYIFVRDIGHIYEVFLRVLFFMTPIFYAPGFLEHGLARYIVILNPLAYVIDFSRTIIMKGEIPTPEKFFLFFFANAFMVGVSFLLFKKFEPRFAEYV